MADLNSQDVAKAIEKLNEILGGKGIATGLPSGNDPKAVREFVDALKDSTKRLKESQPNWKTFNNFLAGAQTGFVDVTNDLERLDTIIKKQKATIADSTDATEVESAARRKAAAEEAKSAVIRSAVTKNTVGALSNFAVGLMGAASTMVNTAFDFAQGLIANKAGNDLYTAAAKGTAKAAQETTGAFAKLIGTLGGIISMVGAFLPGWWKLIAGVGAGLTLFGTALETTSKKAEEWFEKGIDVLNNQLNKTKDAFKDIAGIGGILAGGMTSLTKYSVAAGIDIKVFSEGIKASKDSIYSMGMGFDFAVQRLAGISKVLRSSDLGGQLNKMGYGIQEQIELSAEVMARMRASGDKRIRSDTAVAEATVQYGKDLKVLQALTGGQAKEAMKRARDEALTSGFIAMAGRLGENGMQRIQEVLTFINTQSSDFQEGFKQLAQNQTVTNIPFIQAMQHNTEFAKLINGTLEYLYNGTEKGKKFTDIWQELSTAASKSLQKQLADGNLQGELNAANLASASALQGMFGIFDGVIKKQVAVGEHTLTENEQFVQAMARNRAALDQSVSDTIETNAKLTAEFNAGMFPNIVKFSKHVATGQDLLRNFNTALFDATRAVNKVLGKGNEAVSAVTQKEDPVKYRIIGDYIATGIGALAGAIIGSFGTPAGTVAGGVTGGMMGQQFYNWIMDKIAGPASNANGQQQPAGGQRQASGKVDNGVSVKSSESTAGGAHDPRLDQIAKAIADVAGGAKISALNDTWHQVNKPNSKHTQGKAMDVVFPGMGKSAEDTINKLIANLGINGKASFEKGGDPKTGATADHMHIELMKKGGKLGPGELGIVGEAGAELISGSASVTGVNETTQLFKDLLSEVRKLVRVAEDDRDINQKILYVSG